MAQDYYNNYGAAAAEIDRVLNPGIGNPIKRNAP